MARQLNIEVFSRNCFIHRLITLDLDFGIHPVKHDGEPPAAVSFRVRMVKSSAHLLSIVRLSGRSAHLSQSFPIPNSLGKMFCTLTTKSPFPPLYHLTQLHSLIANKILYTFFLGDYWSGVAVFGWMTIVHILMVDIEKEEFCDCLTYSRIHLKEKQCQQQK